MRVFDKLNRGPVGTHTIIVTPGHGSGPESSPKDWFDKDNTPIQMRVQFVNGVATVDDALGKFLIANGHATKNRPLLRA